MSLAIAQVKVSPSLDISVEYGFAIPEFCSGSLNGSNYDSMKRIKSIRRRQI
jgi:hypothetical protein